MVIGTREHYRWLRGMVIALVMLNAIDGVLTIVWIETGRFTEANPLMDLLLTNDPVLFISVKMLLVCLGILLLWRCRDSGLAVISIFFCFTAYCYVLTFHFDAFNRLLLTG
ncbi:MAG: hypothetical protein KDI43_12745 [Gammaproteobacteria bacterium]|nr:hypothetical protein [Gammaproteobacteria bacterium]MCP5410323.1 hypothetical protein [Chromatiaceae bacterium]MCP5441419.1 hypothetical protein [Chromatiaceae bacterium]